MNPSFSPLFDSLICRALENMLESGEPGVHSFANSVYKVGPDEVASSESEDSEAGAGDQGSLFHPGPRGQSGLYQTQGLVQMTQHQTNR